MESLNPVTIFFVERNIKKPQQINMFSIWK